MTAPPVPKTKPCARTGCNHVITRHLRTSGGIRHGMSDAEWDRRRYCSTTCKGAAARGRYPEPTQTKPCARTACGEILTRRRGEGDVRWALRESCSRSCGAVVRRQRSTPVRAVLRKRRPVQPTTPKPAGQAPPKPARQAPPRAAHPTPPPRPVWRPTGWAPTPRIGGLS